MKILFVIKVASQCASFSLWWKSRNVLSSKLWYFFKLNHPTLPHHIIDLPACSFCFPCRPCDRRLWEQGFLFPRTLWGRSFFLQEQPYRSTPKIKTLVVFHKCLPSFPWKEAVVSSFLLITIIAGNGPHS